MRHNILAYDLRIHSLLKRIDFIPMDIHKESLYEYLRFEMFDVRPIYFWNGEVPHMPRYYQAVLKQIRKLE
jgi:hypothetical protein